MSQLSFFNTTHLTGPELQAAVSQATKQDDLVLEAYRLKQKLTPSDCWQYLIRTGKITQGVPLTSLRRSITVLTKKKYLMNTKEKKMGIFGRPENFWQLK